jgi:hypothetical protein
MLCGGVAWSELPVSTRKQAVPNGNEEEFEGVVKALLSEGLEINRGDDFAVEINTLPVMELLVRTELQFELAIDLEQQWALS